MVSSYSSGKSASEIIQEYELTPSTFHKWIKSYSQSGSFKAKDNQTLEEHEPIEARRELKQLQMENDILIPNPDLS